MPLLLDALAFLLFHLFYALTAILPEKFVFSFAHPLAFVAEKMFPGKKKETCERIRFAFPELSVKEAERIFREMVKHIIWTIMEGMYFLRKGKKWLEGAIEYKSVPGVPDIEEYRGKGTIFFSGHIGNWELLGAWLVSRNLPLVVVEKPQRSAWVRKVLEALRKKSELEWISKDEVDFRELVRALKNGKSVGLISDQNAGKRGVPVEFFGRKTSTFVGVAHLQKVTGNPVVPIFALREKPGKLRVEILPPLNFQWEKNRKEEALEENLRQHNATLEMVIRKHPEQWLWLHRRWRNKE
ncbi:MAG: lysophospholipid acyltransferase family protein [bacterium JZ-2024 1]